MRMTEWGVVQVEKEAVEGSDAHGGHGYVCEGETVLCRGEEGGPWDGRDQSCVSGGCLLSLSLCRRGFQVLLKAGHLLCWCCVGAFQVQ
jgi:hypothetical protein